VSKFSIVIPEKCRSLVVFHGYSMVISQLPYILFVVIMVTMVIIFLKIHVIQSNILDKYVFRTYLVKMWVENIYRRNSVGNHDNHDNHEQNIGELRNNHEITMKNHERATFSRTQLTL